MRPDVTEVDLYSVRELPDAAPLTPDGDWYGVLCDPATGLSYRATQELIGSIISNYLGSGVVIPDRVYRIGVSLPSGVTVSGNTINDPYLDGKVFGIHRRGVELMVKGVEWQNDVPGGGIELLQEGDEFIDGDIITAQFQPQITPYISTPDAISRYSNGVQLISNNTTLTASTYRKLLVITTGSEIILGSDYPENVLCAILQNSVGNKQSTITAPTGQSIAFNGGAVQSIWLGKNERIELIRAGATWYIVNDSMGYDRVGHIVPGRLAGANQIIAQGQTILRADYPRLVDYLTRLNTAYAGTVLNAADWASNKTQWGWGDGSTTIQVPDLRGYFPRWIDLGANVDVDRYTAGTGSKPGSKQGMQIQSHSHAAGANSNQKFIKRDSVNRNQGIGVNNVSGNSREYLEDTTQTTGGNETRPINAGELPLIYV
ncbi:hypothetical protein [Chitinophaga sp.]|uniref:hypothetical protein n=1 Tax=Chitinophaga sp. TaxID=1869181 RepID=UPI0031DFD95E